MSAAGKRLLEGRVAIVTGAAQGIGLAIARTFHAHGARVVAVDLDEGRAREAAESIDAGSVIPLGADVTEEADVARMVAAAVELGRLDVLVNNAGITRDASLKKMTLADFEAVLDVHLKGSWLALRSAVAVMREANAGSIVNISSLSGKSGNPGQTNYSAAKAGIVGLTKAAAKEVAHRGVRVNAIQPGLIRTAMTAAMPRDVFAEREAEIPMRRAGEPEEVASVALFLASDLASYVTGAVIEVGGGRNM